MEQIKGNQLDRFLPGNLTKTADLIYFDGPLLSHFKNNDDDGYLYYWCDSDDDHNRWLVFRVTNRQLSRYLKKETSLRELIENPIDGFLYAVDIDDSLHYENVRMVYPHILPSAYLPAADSYYEFELSSDNEQMRQLFKQTITGLIHKRATVFTDLFVEAFEDIALIKAMDEVKGTPLLSREEAMAYMGV